MGLLHYPGWCECHPLDCRPNVFYLPRCRFSGLRPLVVRGPSRHRPSRGPLMILALILYAIPAWGAICFALLDELES
jgi:hypothetical protein